MTRTHSCRLCVRVIINNRSFEPFMCLDLTLGVQFLYAYIYYPSSLHPLPPLPPRPTPIPPRPPPPFSLCIILGLEWATGHGYFSAHHKLQTLIYDILPSTTAVFSYAIGSRKLSANEQFFCWCSNSSKFVTDNSNKTRRVIYSRQQSLHQHK